MLCRRGCNEMEQMPLICYLESVATLHARPSWFLRVRFLYASAYSARSIDYIWILSSWGCAKYANARFKSLWLIKCQRLRPELCLMWIYIGKCYIRSHYSQQICQAENHEAQDDAAARNQHNFGQNNAKPFVNTQALPFLHGPMCEFWHMWGPEASATRISLMRSTWQKTKGGNPGMRVNG